MHDIHLPEEMDDVYRARRRLVFDELFRVQVALVRRKLELERTTPGIVHDLGGRLVHAFHERLPYPLTGAQERVIAEIEADLGRTFPMHRLLQGDVGSGKTVVAVERPARRGAGRPPGRPDGADRGPGRAAPPRPPGPAGRPDRARRRAR